jgi:hypothetical protein
MDKRKILSQSIILEIHLLFERKDGKISYQEMTLLVSREFTSMPS